ncbi:MAG: tetratricopeptide repeat protein [Bacteroidota bacterium]
MTKHKIKKAKAGSSDVKEVVLPPIIQGSALEFGNFKIQSIVLVIIGLIFYSNSFFNEYALDDGIVIEKNEYVQQGFRGIPKILSTDAYDSFYRSMNAKQQLSGGRYRPLSIVTFAIEQQLFGSKAKDKPVTDIATVRHILNVIFYILSIVVLLYFLQNYIFKDTPLVAFIACLIFLIHPIHTEVIANVKSRDEILSFLFVILTFIAVFRYRETKKITQLFYGMLFYFLAFLSKEYAITLLILIPMLLYIVKGDSLKQSMRTAMPFFVVAILYLLIRYSIVGVGSTTENPDVLNNPFKFATASEKLATRIEILNHYLRLLFYPHPLSADYSYNTIPYTNFSNGWVWFSIILHLSMIIATVVLFFKRNILSFALAFYLIHLALICNLLMDIGATMGERLIYHSSFGFAVIIAVFLNWLLEKLKSPIVPKVTGITLALLVCTWCAAKVIQRNAQWKNDDILFVADAKTVPNSALVNGNAGKAYITLSDKPENKSRETELVNKAIEHLSKAISIHKEYVNGYLNIGVAYFKLKEYEKARANWDIARSIYPNNPFLTSVYPLLGNAYYNQAMAVGSERPKEAMILIEKAIEVDPTNPRYWYDLGGANYMSGDYEKARNVWLKALELKPGYPDVLKGLAALPPEFKK